MFNLFYDVKNPENDEKTLLSSRQCVVRQILTDLT